MTISKTLTTMCRHFDQEERESDGSRHWDSISSVLEKKFAREGARDFSDEVWLQEVFEGSSEKRIEYCTDKDGFICYLGSLSNTNESFWK